MGKVRKGDEVSELLPVSERIRILERRLWAIRHNKGDYSPSKRKRHMRELSDMLQDLRRMQ